MDLITENEEMPTDAPVTDGVSDGIPEEASKEVSDKAPEEVDWEKRCLLAEAALEDSLEFASLYFAEGGEIEKGELLENAVYRRFCELRSMGLSVKEAFSAADSAREKKLPLATKAHLVSSPSQRRAREMRLSGEELAIARNILGDEYSNEELMKLYRRVAK